MEPQHGLASAYDRALAENIDSGIRAAKDALEVYSEAATPLEWVKVKINLANCFLSRVLGERADNVEQALQILRDAGRVIDRAKEPETFAGICHLKGMAYDVRIRGDVAENFELAKEFYEQALEVRTSELGEYTSRLDEFHANVKGVKLVAHRFAQAL